MHDENNEKNKLLCHSFVNDICYGYQLQLSEDTELESLSYEDKQMTLFSFLGNKHSYVTASYTYINSGNWIILLLKCAEREASIWVILGLLSHKLHMTDYLVPVLFH